MVERAARRWAISRSGLEVDRLFVQHRLAAVEMLDELRDAAAVEELVRLYRDPRAHRSA